VKNIFLFIISLFYLNNCIAQDTVERRNRLSDSVIEKFFVLKSDQKVKQGPYKAFFRRKTLIASGNYSKNVKTGIWHFYTTKGRIIEKYNFDTNAYLFEGPLDDNDDLSFIFDTDIIKTDRLTRPLKIGGNYYGYIPYVNLFQLPFDTYDINTDLFDAEIELLISPLGRLADYKVHLTSGYYEYDHTFNMAVSLFSEADRTFIPATLNGEPIISRIIIKCNVTSDGRLDFD
jgi:hypothetical protein